MTLSLRAFVLAAAVLAAGPSLAQTPPPTGNASAPAAPDARGPASSVNPEGTAFILARGERIVVRISEAGKIVLVSNVRVPVNVLAKDAPTFPPLNPGEMAFVLGGVQETGSILKVQTALDYPMQYKALAGFLIKGKLERQQTSTCTVLPKVAGFEHWPDPITFIAIGNIEKHEGAPVCR